MGVHWRSRHAAPEEEVTGETCLRDADGLRIARRRVHLSVPRYGLRSAPIGAREIIVPSDEIHSRLIFEGEHHSIILLDVHELELECRR